MSDFMNGYFGDFLKAQVVYLDSEVNKSIQLVEEAYNIGGITVNNWLSAL